MTTLILYDDSGRVVMAQSGDNVTAENGANITETEIPEGFYPSSVNPDTKEVIFAEIPKTKEQQDIADLKAQMKALIGVNESEETA